MTTLFRDLINDAVAVRMPHTVAVQERIDAAIDQALDEGLDDQAVEDRIIAILGNDPDARAVARQRGSMAAFAEHALIMGATYDAMTDIWSPPPGMTFDGLFAAILARLHSEVESDGSV
ncbi:MAG: hypothetical protein AB7R89_14490 [Dehalococcoidia bacterium]